MIRNPPLFASLRRRIQLLLAAALAPAIALAIGNAYATRARERANITEQAYRLVSVEAIAQQRLIAGTGDLFAAMERLPSVRDLDVQRCRIDLQGILASASTFLDLGVAGPDGTVLCAGRSDRPAATLRARAWFHAARDRGLLSVGGFDRELFAPTPTAILAAGVRDGRVLFAALNLSRLSDLLATVPVPDGSSLIVADADGIILARHPDHDRWVGSTATAPVVAAAAAGSDGTTEGIGVDGVRRFYGFRTVRAPAGTSLTLAVGIPTAAAYAPANQRLTYNLLILGAVATLAFLFAGRMSTALFTRKIESVLRAARRLSAGDLTARTDEAWTPDEVGELVRTFDAMAWTLEHRTADLEHAVASLRGLTARLESIREEERTRISRELHDELGQALTGIRMDLDRLQERIERAAIPADLRAPIDAKLTSVRTLVDGALDTARRVSRQLRPSVLDVLGLGPAIDWQLEEFRARTGISAELLAEPDLPPLPESLGVALFRVLQEALTNVMRHAEATAVTVRLAYEGSQVIMEVMDNGRGFDAGAPISGRMSLGLLGIRERATALGGACEIVSSPGQGTTVRLTIPLDRSRVTHP